MNRITIDQMPPVKNENLIHLERYVKFINSRPERDLKKDGLFFNIHHIVPQALTGSNEKSNLIKLTHREHYIAHLILWKAYSGKMARSFWYMTKNKRFEKITSGKIYENLKWEDCLFQSDLMKRKIRITDGINNKCINKDETIPDGWFLGITNKTKSGPKLGSKLITNFLESRWSLDENIPIGWVYGRPVEKMFITDGLHNKKIEKDCKIPDGYKVGFTFKLKYITNGILNKKIKIEEETPAGWHDGFTSSKRLKGTVWTNNGLTCKQVNPNEIPDGWEFGMLDERMWINNGTENRFIKISEEMPTGFVKGRLSIGYWIHNDFEEKYTNSNIVPDEYEIGRLLSSTKGTFWITNGVENKMVRSEKDIPDGFYKGITKEITRYKLITNGKINKYLLENNVIPSGWRFGTTTNMKKKYWITNGVESIRWDLSNEIPCRWRRGKTVSGFFVTNGVEAKLVKSEEEIPLGWKKGRIKRTNAQIKKDLTIHI